jgi:hypothetical protein
MGEFIPGLLPEFNPPLTRGPPDKGSAEKNQGLVEDRPPDLGIELLRHFLHREFRSQFCNANFAISEFFI